MNIQLLIKTSLKLAFAATLIGFMIYNDMLDPKVLSLVVRLDTFMMCLMIVFATVALSTLRWWQLLRAANIRISLWDTFKLQLIGMFFNFAIPGGVGGDLVKGYYIVGDVQENKAKSATSLLVDRVIGLFSMILMASLVVLSNYSLVKLTPQLLTLFAGILFAFFAFLFLGFILFSRRMREHNFTILALSRLPKVFADVYDALHFYARKPRTLLLAIFYSLLGQLAAVAFFVAVSWTRGETGIPIGAFFFVVPLGFISMALPVAPAGIGVGQAAHHVLFLWYLGHETTAGADALTLFQVFQFVLSVPGLFFYLHRTQTHPR